MACCAYFCNRGDEHPHCGAFEVLHSVTHTVQVKQASASHQK